MKKGEASVNKEKEREGMQRKVNMGRKDVDERKVMK